MKIHILGICGTFMGGIAAIARELGHDVSGCDQGVYPPMSDTLRELGITLKEGYKAEHLQSQPDLVIIGNALSRGNECVEYVLNQQIPYLSGPEWLAREVLQSRHVLAVSGTHGKTTTASLLAWILEYAGLNPGYLIGGVAKNFDTTARLGQKYFVIEADEYDTAFFDKASKFLHYHSRTLIMNNLEFDHADIFKDLEAIKWQFQLLLRTVPGEGAVIFNGADNNIKEVVQRGCWSKQQAFSTNSGWHASSIAEDWSAFDVNYADQKRGHVNWSLLGEHNVSNAIAAIAAAADVGVTVEKSCEALAEFKGIKRRLEIRGVVNDVTIYDDFAHHPTAITKTIAALRRKIGNQRIIAVLQFGSNTMKQGEHKDAIAPALSNADQVVLLEPENFDTTAICNAIGNQAVSFTAVDDIVKNVVNNTKPKDHVLVMSNKGFGGIHNKLLEALS
jgi:UDP-N-acetylmuramate: L-alanyl-gamma-D-glutamyl-meso-diaminopimelate ligase